MTLSAVEILKARKNLDGILYRTHMRELGDEEYMRIKLELHH